MTYIARKGTPHKVETIECEDSRLIYPNTKADYVESESDLLVVYWQTVKGVKVLRAKYKSNFHEEYEPFNDSKQATLDLS